MTDYEIENLDQGTHYRLTIKKALTRTEYIVHSIKECLRQIEEDHKEEQKND